MSCIFPLCKFNAYKDEMCIHHYKYFGSKEVKKEKKPIAKMSDKLKKNNKEYLKIRKQFLTENIKCQVKGCTQVSTEVHHLAGRTGKRLTDVTNFLAVCRSHHQQIELNPNWAKNKGYSKSRIKK